MTGSRVYVFWKNQFQDVLRKAKAPAPYQKYPEEECFSLRRNGIFVVLEDLQDPGNLGTIVRTGEGAGIAGVIMSRETVDIFNPKTIRATMGSIYRVPLLSCIWRLWQTEQ